MDEIQGRFHPEAVEAFRAFLREWGSVLEWTGNPDWPSNTYTIRIDGDRGYIESEEQHEPTVPFGSDPHEEHPGTGPSHDDDLLKNPPSSAP